MSKLIKYGVLIVLLISLSLSASVVVTSNDQKALHKQMGQIDRDYQVSANQQRKTRNSISIDQNELLSLIEKKKLLGISNAEEEAENFLFKREALYKLAITNGYDASDLEVNELVELQKTLFNGPAENKDLYNAYLEGVGLTSDEYWDTQYNVLKKELIISKYVEMLKKQYMNENSIKQWSYDEEAKWSIELDKIVSNATK